MNNFSCSLSCTWMKIIDCLFYASDSLSWDVSWEYIAKLLVAWLYMKFRCWTLKLGYNINFVQKGPPECSTPLFSGISKGTYLNPQSFYCKEKVETFVMCNVIS